MSVRGLVAAGVLVAAVATVVPTTTAYAEPGGSESVSEAGDVGAALVAARRSGHRVESVDRRSETTRVFANPNGSLTAEVAASPQRVRRDDGSWVPVDVRLQPGADGSLAPVATPLDLRLSAGGTGPLVALGRQGKRLALSWPGQLPAPTVDGATATYPEVLPDVDLVVKVERDGFSQVLVVKTPAAAANPALAKVRMATDRHGVRLQHHDDGLLAVDDDGAAIFGSGAAMMWDGATQAAVSAADAPTAPATAGPATVPGRPVPGRRVAMPVEVDDTSIAVTPDREMLSDPAAVFPLYIDPGFSAANWTNISGTYPNQSYWTCGAICDRTHAKVGYAPEDYVLYRSMFRFEIGQFAHALVFDAKFSIDLQHSASCTAHDTGIWSTGDIGPGTTWNNSVWNGGGPVAVRSSQSCHDVRMRDEWSVTSVAQSAADGSWGVIGLGLRAPNESDTGYWKKFDPATAYLTVDYDLAPNTPDAVTVENRPCTTGSGRPVVGLPGTPTLRAHVSDPDGGSVTGRFELMRIRANGSYQATGEAPQQTNVPSGQSAEVTLPAGLFEHGDLLVGAGDWDRDGFVDVLVEDAGGSLDLFPGDGSRLLPRVELATGFGSITVAGVADYDRDGYLDVIGRNDVDTNLYLYPGNGLRGALPTGKAKLGVGWGPFTLAGVGDYDRDGFVDVIARLDTNGNLYFYPGNGQRGLMTGPTYLIGIGWSPLGFFGLADRNGDGKLDIVARDDRDGRLLVYPGEATRTTSSLPAFVIGTGWNGYQAITTPGFNGGRPNDIVTIEPSGDEVFVYPGEGGDDLPRFGIAVSGVSDGSYAFRASATDGSLGSPVSGWCEFTLDTVAPDRPATVRSTDYPADNAEHGGVGRAGAFTLGAAGVTDVAGYLYGTVDPPATYVAAPSPGAEVTVQVVPTARGQNTLYVKSVDRAGNSAPRTGYTFLAAKGPEPVGRWSVADGAPTADTGSPGGRPLTLAGGATAGSGIITLDGSTGYAATGAVVVDTSASFSVAAWVRTPSVPSRGAAAVSQGGVHTGAFQLGSAPAGNRWAFTTRNTDATTASETTVTSTQPPQAGAWTHLVGVYDATAHQVRLYVNGALVASNACAGVATAGGPLQLGRARRGDQWTDLWPGDLDDVRVYDRVVVDTEAPEIAVEGNRLQPAAELAFDEGTGRSAADTSGNGHAGTLVGTTDWGQGNPQDDPTDTGVTFDGTSAAVTTAGPAVRTDQSFTVTAWVMPNSVSSTATVLSLDGSRAGAVALQYRPGAGWCFTRRASDAVGAAVTSACGGVPAVAGTWVHVAGVYDALHATMRLYVNGLPVTQVAAPAGWYAAGPLTVGRAGVGATTPEAFNGVIDDVNAYQGVLPDDDLRDLATS